MTVMSVLDLRPRKLGSFEQYSISLSRALSTQGARSVLVFSEPPPAALLPLYLDAGATLETKPFVRFGRQSAPALRGLLQRHGPDVVMGVDAHHCFGVGAFSGSRPAGNQISVWPGYLKPTGATPTISSDRVVVI